MAGCADEPGGGGGGDAAGGPGGNVSDGAAAGDGDALPFLAEHNYAFTMDYEIGTVEVQAGVDALTDWCGLTRDIRGREVAPAEDVTQVALVRFPGAAEAIVAQLELNQAPTGADLTYVGSGGAGCDAAWTDYAIVGGSVDLEGDMVEDADSTWLVVATDVVGQRGMFRMPTFVAPKDASTNRVVPVEPGSASLAYDPGLADATPLAVTEGARPVLDWSEPKSVYGERLDPEVANLLVVARFPVDTVDEVEPLVLNWDLEADAIYTLDAAGEQVADLALATDADGSPFEGFTADGTWVVAVDCPTCGEPLPLPHLMGVVEVR